MVPGAIITRINQRVFKVRGLARWARDERITDDTLMLAIDEVRRGLVGAILGGGLYKKRIAIDGRGKSGGSRLIVAFHADNHFYLTYGFSKNELANIDRNELMALKIYAKYLLGLGNDQIDEMLRRGDLMEIKNG